MIFLSCPVLGLVDASLGARYICLVTLLHKKHCFSPIRRNVVSVAFPASLLHMPASRMTLPTSFPMRVANRKFVQVPSVGFGTFAAGNQESPSTLRRRSYSSSTDTIPPGRKPKLVRRRCCQCLEGRIQTLGYRLGIWGKPTLPGSLRST